MATTKQHRRRLSDTSLNPPKRLKPAPILQVAPSEAPPLQPSQPQPHPPPTDEASTVSTVSTVDSESLEYQHVKHKITTDLYTVLSLFTTHALATWPTDLVVLEAAMLPVFEATLQRAVDAIWHSYPFHDTDDATAIEALHRLVGQTPKELSIPDENDEQQTQRRKAVENLMLSGYRDILLWSSGMVTDWSNPQWRAVRWSLEERRRFWEKVLRRVESLSTTTAEEIRRTAEAPIMDEAQGEEG
ncbi:hypothetical protein BJ508DRAFT_310352 [Ascobolus immersus RN42]|uniref:Uncharacterized protein n=1 Tax=Ascobolus immersus RN42 TaxID=1160509 RepID=A0A3N4I5Z8_ASCIM|nr:hypothetical protein BJ508DRAFT_310352 [Ascobolus immersus RN42]